MQAYDKCKMKHICVSCYKQDDRTLAGHTLCKHCNDKSNKRQNDRYAYRKAHRLCTVCGEPLPNDCKYISCKKCRILASQRKRHDM